MTVTVVDGVLGLAMLASLGLIVFVSDRRVQVGSFRSFGVIISLVWLRLGALDVAFAEAALGTGMLSVVLVWLAVRHPVAPAHSRDPDGPAAPHWLKAGVGLLSGAVLTVTLGSLVLQARHLEPAWTTDVPRSMPEGVSHGITGVLLAFRAYDTLLESAVLLASSVLNAMYFLPVVYRLWFRPAPGERIREPLPLLVPALSTTALVLLFGTVAAAPFMPLDIAGQVAEKVFR